MSFQLQLQLVLEKLSCAGLHYSDGFRFCRHIARAELFVGLCTHPKKRSEHTNTLYNYYSFVIIIVVYCYNDCTPILC